MGKNEATPSTDLYAYPDRVMQALLPKLTAANEARARQLIGYARYRWPVGREQSGRAFGHSKDAFVITDKSDSLRLKFLVENQATDQSGERYTFYIKSKQRGLGGKSVWVELIRKELPNFSRLLAEDVVKIAAKVVENG